MQIGEDIFKQNSDNAKENPLFLLSCFIVIFDISVLKNLIDRWYKNTTAANDNVVNNVFGNVVIAFCAKKAPRVIKMQSPKKHPHTAIAEVLYPFIIAIFAIVKKPGPTAINIKKIR